ncbi:potassium channel family protein [Colwellia sp. D2M02]|uniref:Potassium channel domain-containing protein n=1 Tax=Colwellia asteriadis TaxID=517723 RepID=A0ABN1L4G0_9GAMM|nr:potassium channel family protein [Colwellia sp. D2M02]MBU2894086.1 potassium channel family protein [Colwellia sp. D2M02]
MIILQNAMEKSNLYQVDEFGVKNYNYGALGLLSFVLFVLINASLGYITYLAEINASGSPVQNYSDAFWLMLMSSTTIGFGDVYPITLAGRAAVFIMFVLGVGILGGVGAVFANKIFGFADTSIKNRELRKQNDAILKQNEIITEKLTKLEEQLANVIKHSTKP